MKKPIKTNYYLLLLFIAGKSFGQPVELRNASFEEDKPESNAIPTGWYYCGSSQAERSSIQPGFEGVDLLAADGTNYVGLLVRDNGKTDAIGQALMQPLVKDSIYVLTLSVARSLQWMAPTRNDFYGHNSYATPAMLKIWGGSRPGDQEQLLAETKMIVNSDWLEIRLTLHPEIDITYLCLKATHKTPNLFPYNGNILIDNLLLTRGE